MPPPSPVRIHRAALNLSLPDDHDRQRFSRRLEQALRSSLAAIPDRLLPQVEETLHLGTLNLDLGELDLNNGSRLEGLFHERLQQRLLALLKQAARAAAPAAATAARSYPKPAVEPESGRSRQNPRSRAIASVRQQLQNLFRLAGQQLPAAGPAVADHNPKKQATTVNEIKALCADLASVSRGTQLPAELRTALAKLVTDLECWLSPGPDTAHALSEISECLKPLQQACAESTDAMGASDEQLLLQVLDKPLRASEPNQPVAEVSCIALEGVLKALVVRRQLSPAVAGRLGLWLARQAQLAPVLRLRRMQALHRYLRTHSGKTGELVTVLSQEDSVDGAAVEDHHPNTGNALSVTESGAVRVSELSEDSAQISTRDQDSAAGVDQKTPQPLKTVAASTPRQQTIPLSDSPDVTHRQNLAENSAPLADKTFARPEPVSAPVTVSKARIQWLVDTLLRDPQLSCQLAVSLRQWRQQYEQLSPLSRYHWLAALLPEVKKGREETGTEAQREHDPEKTTTIVEPEWRRLQQRFITSWASAPVHTLHADWWPAVEPFTETLAESEDRLVLSRAIQRLFVVASVAAEQHTEMASWLRRYRKRWQQWLRQLDPASPDLSFTLRAQLWSEPQETLPGWSAGELVLTLEQQMADGRLTMARSQRVLEPLKQLVQASKSSPVDQLAAATRHWLAAAPTLPVSCRQVIEQRLMQPASLTALSLQEVLKATGKQLEQEMGAKAGQLGRWRQLTAAVLNRQPPVEIAKMAESLPLPPALESRSPVTSSEKIPDTLIEQGQQLLKDLKQALRPARVYPLEHDYLVSDSGLVLLWPHLSRLFSSLLDDSQQWLSPHHQWQALAHLLYLGNTLPDEDNRSPVAALLVGLSPDTPMPELPTLTESQLAACDLLLGAVIKQWRALKAMATGGLQQLFIQRTGYLDQTANGWRLTTEHQPQDILMQALPWPVSVVHLPWMEHLLAVEWHTGPTGLWKPFQ